MLWKAIACTVFSDNSYPRFFPTFECMYARRAPSSACGHCRYSPKRVLPATTTCAVTMDPGQHHRRTQSLLRASSTAVAGPSCIATNNQAPRTPSLRFTPPAPGVGPISPLASGPYLGVGSSGTFANAINDAGQVAGYLYEGFSHKHHPILHLQHRHARVHQHRRAAGRVQRRAGPVR